MIVITGHTVHYVINIRDTRHIRGVKQYLTGNEGGVFVVSVKIVPVCAYAYGTARGKKVINDVHAIQFDFLEMETDRHSPLFSE